MKNLEGSMMGTGDISLSINGIVPYQPHHGLNELKIVSYFLIIYFIFYLLSLCWILFFFCGDTVEASGVLCDT